MMRNQYTIWLCGLPRLHLLLLFRFFTSLSTAARQAPLSSTISWSLLKFMSIKLVIPFNHLILCRHLLLLPSVFPHVGVFSNESLFVSDGQSIGASASATVLPMNIQSSFPLGLTDLISLQFKRFKSPLQHRNLKA